MISYRSCAFAAVLAVCLGVCPAPTEEKKPLEPPLVTFEAARANYVKHTCRWDGRLMAILDAAKFLGASEGPVGSASESLQISH